MNSGNATDSDEMNHAEKLLNVEEHDVVKASFIVGGSEKTTQQQIVDVVEDPHETVIYGEECEGWNGPSTAFVVNTHPSLDGPQMAHEVRHPFRDPTPVTAFTDVEVNPDGE